MHAYSRAPALRLQYKFTHRANGRYYWEARFPWLSSHVERVSCPVDWFWAQR